MTATRAAQQLLTAEEFYHLPDPTHGGKMELVRGKVVVHMPVGRPHARIAGELARLLGNFVAEHRLGEIHVELGHRVEVGPDTVRAPDVSFMSNELLANEPDEGFAIDGPTLAIEVMSPGDREREVMAKVAEYLSAGSERVWVVQPRVRTVIVHRRGGLRDLRQATDTLSSDDAGFGTPGFTLRVGDLFP